MSRRPQLPVWSVAARRAAVRRRARRQVAVFVVVVGVVFAGWVALVVAVAS